MTDQEKTKKIKTKQSKPTKKQRTLHSNHPFPPQAYVFFPNQKKHRGAAKNQTKTTQRQRTVRHGVFVFVLGDSCGDTGGDTGGRLGI